MLNSIYRLSCAIVLLQYKCCGIDKYEDWRSAKFGTDSKQFGDSTDSKVPASCCKGIKIKADKILDCQKNAGGTDYKMEGCLTKLKDDIKNNKAKILGVAITILVVMVSFV